MKKLLIYSFILLSATLSSCNNFLDVSERDDMKHEVLFSSEDGFQQALMGAYIKCASISLYGRMTSYYLPEIMARTYFVPADINKSDSRYVFSEYAFDEYRTNVDGTMSGIWNTYFRVISALNDIIAAMDENEDVKFHNINEKLIYGEAYALRAFLHLDILRLWGKVPSTYQDGDKALPYVVEFTRDNNKLKSRTFAEFKQLIEADLNKAEEILKGADPLITYTMGQIDPRIPQDRPDALTDDWHMYRQYRMNYWAVLATKARYYQWIGDTDKATEYAYRVVASNKFRFTVDTDYSGSRPSLIFREEIIFGLENPDLLVGDPSPVEAAFFGSNPSLTQTLAALNTAFESAINPNDIRYGYNAQFASARYFAGTDPTIAFYKFGGQNKDRFPELNTIPVLRLSEMYLILMENLPLDAGVPLSYLSDFSETEVATPTTLSANEYWLQYRTSRSMSEVLNTALAGDRMGRLNIEYRKEFYGEGQIWYFFKRQNLQSFSWPETWPKEETTTSVVYELPRPEKVSLFDN